MAVLNGVKISIEDTGSPALAADDAAEIIRKILQILESKNLSVVYAATDPHVTITVT